MRTIVPIPIYIEFPFLAAPGVDRRYCSWRHLRDWVSVQLPTDKPANRWRGAGFFDGTRKRETRTRSTILLGGSLALAAIAEAANAEAANAEAADAEAADAAPGQMAGGRSWAVCLGMR